MRKCQGGFEPNANDGSTVSARENQSAARVGSHEEDGSEEVLILANILSRRTETGLLTWIHRVRNFHFGCPRKASANEDGIKKQILGDTSPTADTDSNQRREQWTPKMWGHSEQKVEAYVRKSSTETVPRSANGKTTIRREVTIKPHDTGVMPTLDSTGTQNRSWQGDVTLRPPIGITLG